MPLNCSWLGIPLYTGDIKQAHSRGGGGGGGGGTEAMKALAAVMLHGSIATNLLGFQRPLLSHMSKLWHLGQGLT